MVDVEEGGGIGWGGVEGWGEKAENCNWITIKKRKRNALFFFLWITYKAEVLWPEVIIFLNPFTADSKKKHQKLYYWLFGSSVYKTWCFHQFFSRTFFIVFRERERVRERHIDTREKHQSVASFMHLDQGLNLQPRFVPWLGFEPATFWCMGWCSNQQSHISQSSPSIFMLLLRHWRVGNFHD